nr:hypothetical protein CFP56_58799 [Quercus suber]
MYSHTLWLVESCAPSSRTDIGKHGQSREFLDTPERFRKFLTSSVARAVVDYVEPMALAKHYRQIISAR